ncbi:MAG: SDR family oxidoreductase [Pseudomonadales bacterium]|nr:SDR family oxidoreductase [Pseudomonadales bacterium]MCP5183798.1 SDR family oxidoreductase [Pseudomonadales bacterium]
MTERTKGRLEGRVALITGASRGIGLAIARAYLQEGAAVFLTARDGQRLQALRDDLALAHGAARVGHLAVDIAGTAAADAVFQAAVAWRDGLDVVVNNAGIYAGAAFTDYSFADFDKLVNTNVRPVFRLMQLAIAHMQPRRGGKIVNVASTAGKWESANQALYNMSKHAVVGLTRCAALENGRFGLNINAICPGMVNTDMFQDFSVQAELMGTTLDAIKARFIERIPLGRFVEPEEVAHLAVYLASAESDGMTGQTLTISGGMRMG